jgi:hypothetical protein
MSSRVLIRSLLIILIWLPAAGFSSAQAVCTPPTINVTPPSDKVTGYHCDLVAFAFAADPGLDDGEPALPLTWSVIDGPGAIDSDGLYRIGPDQSGLYEVRISATNSCGQSDDYTFTVNLMNHPIYVKSCGCIENEILAGRLYEFDFGYIDGDPCDDPHFSLLVITPTPTNAPTIDSVTGLFQWQTDVADTGQTFEFVVRVEDGQGSTGDYYWQVDVRASVKFVIEIDPNIYGSIGDYSTVPISMTDGSEYIGGFDFVIEYDQELLTFVYARLGEDTEGCFEYFTYSFEHYDGCVGRGCPDGLIRLTGIADIQNGDSHPDPACLNYEQSGLDKLHLADLIFRISNERRVECEYTDVRFFWGDCRDNSIWSMNNDTLWLSKSTYIYDLMQGMVEISGDPYYGGHWWLGDCQGEIPEYPTPEYYIDYIHGGVDIVCTDSSNWPCGDLNLNDIYWEIADAVLYANYFIYGLAVFDLNVTGQVAASDVNLDGDPLKLDDFVCLIDLINAEIPDLPKEFQTDAKLQVYFDRVVTIESDVPVGAILMTFDGPGQASLISDDMLMLSDVVAGKLKVLIWSDNGHHISSGRQEIIAVDDDIQLTDVSAASADGIMLAASIESDFRPQSFAVYQNYPNPFNPETRIEFFLPERSDWELQIVNVLSQVVEVQKGTGQGLISLTWRADDAPSGVYFYKVISNGFSQTRKMLLMK